MCIDLSLLQNLYPTAILGGLGALGMAYFRHVIGDRVRTTMKMVKM